MTISPIAIIVVSNDNVRVMQMEPSHGSLDNIVGMAPDIIEKIKSFFSKSSKDKSSKNEAVESDEQEE
jgi:uncharacterized spore protein YtfJ